MPRGPWWCTGRWSIARILATQPMGGTGRAVIDATQDQHFHFPSTGEDQLYYEWSIIRDKKLRKILKRAFNYYISISSQMLDTPPHPGWAKQAWEQRSWPMSYHKNIIVCFHLVIFHIILSSVFFANILKKSQAIRDTGCLALLVYFRYHKNQQKSERTIFIYLSPVQRHLDSF